MAENGKKDNFSVLSDIYREVGETKVTVENIDKRLAEHIQYSLKELSRINELDAEQNRILAKNVIGLDKHIEGVNTLKEMHVAHRNETKEQINILKQSLEIQKEEHESRIQNLETPYKSLKFIGKASAWILGVCGAASLILTFLGVI